VSSPTQGVDQLDPVSHGQKPLDPRWYTQPEYRTGSLRLPDSSALAEEGKRFHELLKRRLRHRDVELPAFPRQIFELLELMRNPNVDATQVDRCLRSDPVVAAEVLRFANSALYAPTERIADLKHAIAFLGFRRLHALALGIAAKVAAGAIVQPLLARRLWTHSVGVGAFAMFLARDLRIDEESAFLGGLLHDVGKIAIAPEIGRIEKTRGVKLSDAEIAALLELHHVEVGRAVAQHWKLPEFVHAVIAHHHGPQAPERDRKLAAAVDLADKLAYALGLGGVAQPCDVFAFPSLEALGLKRGAIEQLYQHGIPAVHAEVRVLS